MVPLDGDPSSPPAVTSSEQASRSFKGRWGSGGDVQEDGGAICGPKGEGMFVLLNCQQIQIISILFGRNTSAQKKTHFNCPSVKFLTTHAAFAGAGECQLPNVRSYDIDMTFSQWHFPDILVGNPCFLSDPPH